MARRLRVEYAGAIYHVMNRGDRRESIFKDDEDRQRFVATLGGSVCAERKDSAAGRRELERVLEARRGAEADEGYRSIRRGWFFGEKELKKELLSQMSERIGPEHYGEERQESQAEKAERVVGEELRRRGWTEATLGERTKGDPEQVRIAVRLRKETLATVAWIAERLRMGSVAKRERVALPMAARQGSRVAGHKN